MSPTGMKRLGGPRELTKPSPPSSSVLSLCSSGSSPDSSQTWQWVELLLVMWVGWDSGGLKDGLWWKTVSLELNIAFGHIFFVLQDAYVCFNFDFNF